MQKKFIPRWRSCTNYKFVHQKNHTSPLKIATAILQALCIPSVFSARCLLTPTWVASETCDFNNALHFIHFSSTFCSFFKFSFQINPNALKRIEYQNNPYIYPGYSFRATKMFQCGEFEKWTNHNLIFISKTQPKNWR